MHDLKRAKIKRGAQRAQATKIWGEANTLMNAEIVEVNVEKLRVMLATYDAKIELLRKLDETVSDLIQDERGLETEIVEADNYLTGLTQKRYAIESFINQNTTHSNSLASPVATATLQNGHVFSTQSTPPQSQNTNSHRLPKLALPVFNGNPLKWQTFWDSYKVAIHENSSLSDIQKFTYLKAQVSSEAAQSIEGLPLTESNYAQSVEILEQRFGQPHKITNAHMQALLDLPCPSDSVSTLRQFYDSMENHIRGLEALGKKQDTYGDLLVPIILSKLPSTIKRSLIRENGSTQWSVEQLRKSILKEIQILEAGEETDSFNQMSQLRKSVNTLPSTSTLLTNASGKFGNHANAKESYSPKKRTTNKRLCIFCSGHHHPNECTVVNDPAARKNIVFEAKLCFNCLNTHRVSDCNSRNRCRRCNKKHHTSLCHETNKDATKNTGKNHSLNNDASNITTQVQNAQTHPSIDKIPDQTSSGTPVNRVHSSLSVNNLYGKQTLLKTAINTVKTENKAATAHILFDEGAQRSFITQSLADELELTPIRSETLNLSVFGGSSTSIKQVDVATIHLSTENGETIPIQVLIIPTIAVPQKSFLTAEIRNLPHLNGLKLAHPMTTDDHFHISLLIGADHYWDVVEDEIVRGPGPTAAKSRIGYLLSGPTTGPTPVITSLNATVLKVIVSNEHESKALERFWNLESIGILPNEITIQEDKFVQEYQDSSIRLENGRYCAKLPWKPNHDPLPTNEAVARGRTRSTVRRLAKNPEMLKTYDELINEQLQRGFIERVANPETTNGYCHYIPHHAVLKDSPTTPIRIVYDCSCRPNANQPSLNSCLSIGPDILNDMTAILVRFRCYRYALTADIEKAFLNISLDEEDRDATRFFWLSDPTNPESSFDVFRFKSILFGASCSPFILNATIKKHLDNHNDPITQRMKAYIYVDNLASGTDNEDEATIYFKHTRSVMSSANFNLREWNSNSSKLRALANDENAQDENTETKLLGLRWNSNNDTLKLQEKRPLTTDPKEMPVSLTKRDVLRVSSKIYDPLGLITPVTIRAKIFLQELWELKYAWDEPLPEPLIAKWFELSADLETATQTEVQRRYFPLTPSWPSNAVMHIFVDASTKAYGTVAYVTSDCSMVMSKSRVAPLKKLTLPQLELMAAVTGARLASYLSNHLKVIKTVFWSDSQIVIHWLSSQKELKCFVQNRVKEIHQLTNNATWNYCPTTDNPADLLTRGISADNLSKSTLWTTGPPWITNPDNWPAWNPSNAFLQSSLDEDQDASEVNPTDPNTPESPTPTHTSIAQIITPTRFSDLQRLLRTTAWVLRFANARKNVTVCKRETLQVHEIENARNVWIREIQNEAYGDEFANLQREKTPRLPLVRQLRLFTLDDNIIRCGGRIHNAPVEHSAKFPILLPANHHFTLLVINDAHKRLQHAGLNQTLTHIRQKYWIPTARQYIKKTLRRCVTCRKVLGTPYTAPDPPPLPTYRMIDSHPFTVTGVDFTGAIYVKTPQGQEKVYICLFTCANTRAVHLEVVPNLTVPTFMSAFRRFASRKSLPRIMVSDNASTYQSAAEELTLLFNSTELETNLSQRGIQWKFIPKRAPWYGGFWERLVGLTKNSLKKVLGKANVSLEELQTISTETEAILNDRPLTYVSSELKDEEPLTPSHLLYGRRITTLPHPLYEDDEISDATYEPEANNIDVQAKLRTHLVQHFWKRWRQEYLTSLREFHKTTGNNSTEIRVGDVVHVHDDTKRVNWRLAIVESLIKGKDGLVRAANIKTSTGRTNRPITKLYPLEVRSNSRTTEEPKITTDKSPDTKNPSTNPHSPDVTDRKPSRPVRAKAQSAREKLKLWTSILSRPPEDVEN